MTGKRTHLRRMLEIDDAVDEIGGVMVRFDADETVYADDPDGPALGDYLKADREGRLKNGRILPERVWG